MAADFRARQMVAVFVLIKYRNRFSILAQTQAHTNTRRTISIYVWPSGYPNHQAINYHQVNRHSADVDRLFALFLQGELLEPRTGIRCVSAHFTLISPQWVYAK